MNVTELINRLTEFCTEYGLAECSVDVQCHDSTIFPVKTEVIMGKEQKKIA